MSEDLSNLALAFQLRQPFRFHGSGQISHHPLFKAESVDSISTVSSQEAAEIVKQYQEAHPTPPKDSLAAPPKFIFHSSEVKFGEQITNVYQKIFKDEMKDPQAVLSDPEISLTKKILFVFAQRWCWGIIFTVLLMVTVLLLVNTLMILLKPSQPILSIVTNEDLGLNITGIQALKLPVERVIITHTQDSAESCRNREQCIARIRNLQVIYSYLPAIPYNFLVGNDHRVYEIRGFEFEGEIPSNDSSSSFNETGLIVAFIGTFNDQQPSRLMLDTFQAFLDNSVKKDLMTGDYQLFAQDQLVNSNQTANGLLDALKEMDRFQELLNITSRQQWGAASPKNQSFVTKFHAPPEVVFLRYQAYDFECSNFVTCSKSLQSIQTLNFGEGLNDIRYNFIISKVGVFEGRGWDARPEEDVDTLSVGFFAGKFMEIPTQDEVKTLNATLNHLIKDGISIGKLNKSVEIVCETTCLQ